MTNVRIMMPKGHLALSLEGHTYLPDDAGAFTVPAGHAAELVRVHGGRVAPSVADMLSRAEELESKARAAVKQAEALTEEAKALRKNAEAETMRVKAEQAAKAKEAEATASNDGKDGNKDGGKDVKGGKGGK